jgi:hypothetical protein
LVDAVVPHVGGVEGGRLVVHMLRHHRHPVCQSLRAAPGSTASHSAAASAAGDRLGIAAPRQSGLLNRKKPHRVNISFVSLQYGNHFGLRHKSIRPNIIIIRVVEPPHHLMYRIGLQTGKWLCGSGSNFYSLLIHRDMKNSEMYIF